MEDEIKEILDRAKKLKDKCSCCEQIGNGVYISKYHEIETQNLIEAVYIIDKLLDYITNLHEELEEEKRIEQASLDTIQSLEEENERLEHNAKVSTKWELKLSQENQKLKEELQTTQEKWKKDKQWVECRTKEWLNYKSAIDKANEFIKEHTNNFAEYLDVYEAKELSNILQGEDKKMNYDLDGICQDCIYLDKIKPLFEEKDKEIKRLNNIINELEKYLENEIRLEMSLDRDMVLRDVFTKLLELKGSDKE